MARRLGSLPKEMNVDLDSKLFNTVYYPYLHTVNSYEVYYGGSGSGKSRFIAQKLAIQMSLMPGRNLICLRRQKTDCISSCWAEVINMLKKFRLFQYWDMKENPDHILVNRVNGNQILFEGVDNIEDIKSIQFVKMNEDSDGGDNLTDVWYEEANAEPTSKSIDEIDRRLRDSFVKTRIIISFNPVSRSHWLFKYVMEDLAVQGVDSMVLKTTYKNNRFLPSDYGVKMERLKFTNPYDYQVYALGNWGTLGKTIFNADKIQIRLTELESVIHENGYFHYTMNDITKRPEKDTYRFIKSSDGDIAIFEQPKPMYPYVLAIDTAGDGSDYYACHVMDNISGVQVARFHSQGKPSDCLWQLYGLANMYNQALVCIEINFDTMPQKEFQNMDYPNIYRRRSASDKTHIKNEDKYGWRTGSENRQMMLSDMVMWTDSYMYCINDVDTLNEMLTFTKQDKKLKGIWSGAEPGEHDDLVMSFAILLQARTQQSCEMIPDVVKLKGSWTREEIEDAIEEGRIDRLSALEYKRTVGYYCEQGENDNGRSGRYARR